MKKNVASQVIGCQLISKTDGSAVTAGTTTIYVCGDGGTQAAGSVGSGACTHEGNGYWTYAPAQAETNYDMIAFTFVNTSACNVTVQVFTSFPQTVDNATNISAIKTKTDFLPSATAGAAGGVFIAGSNAATSVTTALTANITGNLSGSVGSVTGAVGSVTGAVGSVAAGVTLASGTHTGAVIPTVTDVTNKTGYALSAAGVDAVLDETSTGLIGAPNTLRGLIWFVRQFVKNKLKYDKALNQMILYEDDGLTAKLTHAMTDDANEATRGAGS